MSRDHRRTVLGARGHTVCHIPGFATVLVCHTFAAVDSGIIRGFDFGSRKFAYSALRSEPSKEHVTAAQNSRNAPQVCKYILRDVLHGCIVLVPIP